LVTNKEVYNGNEYYYKEDLLTPYIYTTDNVWNNDVNSKKVYKCIMYPLLEVIPTIFIPSTGSEK